jgi:tRNA (guanosine-2'-O-)-methyltransferase
VKRLNRSWRRATGARVALLLDSVTQPFNVGMIVRSAAAFGAEHIWLCGNSAPLDHPSAAKTALGTQRLLSWEREPDPVAAAKAARADGLRVVAIEQAAGAYPLHEAPLHGDICLVLGPAGGGRRGCLHPAGGPGGITQRVRRRRRRPGRGAPPGVVRQLPG